MKKGEKIAVIILVILVILLFTWPLIIAETWNVQSGHKPMINVMFDNIVDDIKNRKNYDKYAQEYIKSKFGEALLSKIEISMGMRTDSNKYAYRVKFDDILSKNFVIYVTANGGYTDNFPDILATDSKFQHLYSEWVKKQAGIEDSNVELKFTGNFDKPYIEFDKITSLSDDYREIFENTHNLYAWLCEVSNIKDLNEDNKLEIATKVKDEYLLKAMEITDISKDETKYYGGHIDLSDGNFDIKKSINYTYVFDVRNNGELIERKY